MSKMSPVEILLLVLGVLVDQTIVATAKPSYTKPNCTETCGNLTIPFPFGIGTGCFLDEWYEIDCRENDSLPILKKTHMEVLNISIGTSNSTSGSPAIIVNLPTFDSNTNCIGNRANTPVSLEGSPFYFSRFSNIFTAIGCGVLSAMDKTQSAVVGCRSHCNFSSIYSNCTGVDDCCSATITDSVQRFDAGFSREETADDEECRYAFLMDSSWLNRNSINLSALKVASHVPAVLEWGIPSDTDIVLNSSLIDSYFCDNFSTRNVVKCGCLGGYRGNPYLTDGCEDIDECQEGISHCSGSCVNRSGTYRCVDRARTIKLVAIGIGAVLGALLLFYSSGICGISS